MKRLIVNADDFGLTKGVNEGIVKAHKDGILTSTTIMVNMPYAEEAIEVSKEYPELGFGVHITLDAGAPISPIKEVFTLVDENGNFKRGYPNSLDDVNVEEVELEIRAQIEKALSYGINITHLDSHHHAQAHPKVKDVFLELAEEYGLPVRSMFDKEDMINLKVDSTDKFIDSFYDKGVTLDNLADVIINSKEESVEIMTHPAEIDDRLVEVSSYNKARKRELNLLRDKKIIKLLEYRGIKLVNFSVFK